MKKTILLSFLVLFTLSCSDDSFLMDENSGSLENAELVELSQNASQLSEEAKNIVANSADLPIGIDETGGLRGPDNDKTEYYDVLCAAACESAHRACTDQAFADRDYGLADCESIRIIGTNIIDVYCTRTIIVGYNTIITPEGEEIQIPITQQEQFVCDQEEVIIYTQDPVLLQQYQACRTQVYLTLADELDDCLIKRDKCLKPCKIAGPQ